MDYAKTTAKAQSLISRFGTTMAVRVVTPGTYDPATGVESGDTSTDHDCVGVMTNISQRYVDGQRVLASDKLAVIGGSVAVRPQPGDNLVVDDEVWTILDVISVAPAGEAIIYKLQVRRG